MKFGVVGVVATVIDFGIMNLLHYGLGLNILIANTSGFIVSLIFNYVASMKYVFAHKEGMSPPPRVHYLCRAVRDRPGAQRRYRAGAQRRPRARGQYRQDLRHRACYGLQLCDPKDLPGGRGDQVARPPRCTTGPTDDVRRALRCSWALLVYGRIYNVCGLSLANMTSSYSSWQSPYVSLAKALKYPLLDSSTHWM